MRRLNKTCQVEKPSIERHALFSGGVTVTEHVIIMIFKPCSDFVFWQRSILHSLLPSSNNLTLKQDLPGRKLKQISLKRTFWVDEV